MVFETGRINWDLFVEPCNPPLRQNTICEVSGSLTKRGLVVKGEVGDNKSVS
jgi:hypothetical protein